MAKVMTNLQFIEKLKNIVYNYKTIYVLGCFGAPMTKSNIQRYINAYSYNNRTSVRNSTPDVFGFDCVNLAKGVLWGWHGDKNDVYGGAKYCANGVPDIGADYMITLCDEVSTDFSKIEIGEAVWMSGHIGYYIGDGLAIECTPKWKNCVQVTAVANIGAKAGYNARKWTKHGKLPWLNYIPEKKKTIDEIAQEVLDGKWGNGADRKQRITNAGYDYNAVQNKVNELITAAKKAAKGDIDGDGKVTAADARIAMRAAVGLEKLNDKQKEAADMDDDGKITAGDGRAVLRKSVGLDEK